MPKLKFNIEQVYSLASKLRVGMQGFIRFACEYDFKNCPADLNAWCIGPKITNKKISNIIVIFGDNNEKVFVIIQKFALFATGRNWRNGGNDIEHSLQDYKNSHICAC